MSLHGYEEIDHTADIALRVWGESFDTLLIQSACGLYDQMGITFQRSSTNQHDFILEKGERETILVDFLNELLYLVEERNLMFEEFQFVDRNKNLIVRGQGSEILSIKRIIKAVTFHNLKIRETKDGLRTIITFDV